MIKLTFCLIRREDFTREAFHDYWRNRHAPLVASVREVLRIRRYVQLHSLPPDGFSTPARRVARRPAMTA